MMRRSAVLVALTTAATTTYAADSPQVKRGKHLVDTRRPIMPPMPWPAYRNLSDEDLKAMFAFLKTVPPVKNRVPDAASPK